MPFGWDARQDKLLQLLKHFRSDLGQQRGPIGLAVLLLVTHTAVELLVPWPLKVVVDNVLREKPLEGVVGTWLGEQLPSPKSLLWVMVCATVLIGALNAILDYLAQRLLLANGQRMGLEIRKKVYSQLQRLSFAFHTRTSVGDLTARVTSDVNTLQDLFVGWVKNVVSNGLLLIGMFSVMLVLDWKFTLVSLSVMPILLYLVLVYRPKVKKASKAAKRKEREIASLTQETLVSFRVVQAFAAEEYEDRRFATRGTEAMRARLKAGVLAARFSPAVDVTLAAGTALVVGLGALKVFEGELSVGLLLVFLAYLKAMYQPMKALAKSSGQLANAGIASELLLEILEEGQSIEERPDAVPAPRFEGDLQLQDVTFSYGGERRVLENVCLNVRAGQHCVIVGPTGAGKSTLISLLPRFIDPEQGAVRIDGRDVKEFTLKSLRENIAIVLQEAILFRMSVRDNIAYGLDDVTEEQILAAATAANAHEFISRQPEAYDTMLAERGGHLSGGQRQRITLARAFLRNAPILLLDEPTTGLDLASETLVLEAIERLTAGRTTLTIAHRLSTIERADVIVVVEDGRVLDSGTHAELVARSARYRELYLLQIAESEKREEATEPEAVVPA